MTAYLQQVIANSQQRPMPFSTGNSGGLLFGDKQAKAVKQICDFTTVAANGAGYVFDATPFIQRGEIRGIQTIFIDNTNNNSYVNVSNPAYGLSISLPPTYQGFFNVIAAEGSGNQFLINCPTGTGVAVVQFLNVLVPPSVWAGLNPPVTSGTIQPVSDAILDACVFGGRLNTSQIESQATEVDRSGVILNGGAAQVLMPANPNRRGYRIQNNDNSAGFLTEPLYVCTTGNAVIGDKSSLILNPPGGATYAGGAIDGKGSNAISVIATTTGHKFYAIEW